jgi:two-component system sensor histidine kinase DesK
MRWLPNDSLLPKDKELGWTPYAWLVYLAIFLAGPWIGKISVAEVGLTLLGLAVFLPLYFYGFWASGRRLLAVIAAVVLLGVVYAPINYGGSVFFIYGAGFLGHVTPPSRAVRILGLIVLAVAVESWWFALAPQSWIPAIVVSLLIGGVNIHYGEVRRANLRLKLAQQEVQQLATVAERERIARDLHDLLGHTLSVITLKAELAAKLVDRDPARAASEMREVEKISREALSEVRQTVRGYRALGLQTELTQAKVALAAAGIELTVTASPFDLPATHEGVLALALREAVTNVVRHAGAGHCRVELRQHDGAAHLVVADDGRGGRPHEGSGLSGMRERVEGLAGTLTVEGADGFRLSVRLPLAGDRRAGRGTGPPRRLAAGGEAS